MNYNEQILGGTINEATKTAIGIICFGIPPVLMIISLIIFSTKFKLYGDLKQKVHDYIADKRAKESAEKTAENQ